MEKYSHYRTELDTLHPLISPLAYQIVLELIDKAEREGVRLGTLATNNY